MQTGFLGSPTELYARDKTKRRGTATTTLICAVKRIVQHLSPRETRIVALGKTSDCDRALWYFQRYVPYLPAAEELVLFNRSWCNRPGVERVMGFCPEAEQKQRLDDRKTGLFKQWEISPIDDQTVKYWKTCSSARNEMLARMHNLTAPWTLVHANDKRLARLNIIKDVLSRLHNVDKDDQLVQSNPQIVFGYDLSNLENGQFAK